jgi:hypothetical protein
VTNHDVSISDYYSKWAVHGRWACGHRARIDLGRFIAWGMADVPMLALCKRLRCPECGARGPAEIGTSWLGRDAEQEEERNAAERLVKVRQLKPREPK